MQKKDILGMAGEEAAVEYLRQSGYNIICRNWKLLHYEIDIIAEHDNYLIIVEVKTRSTDDFGNPQDFVSRKKQTHLVRAAQLYVEKYSLENEIRFDVIAIILNQRETRIEHIPGAFIPLLGM